MKLKSWSCNGCTNIIYKKYNDKLMPYCKPEISGTHKLKWNGDTIYCLNKIKEKMEYYDIMLEI